MSGPMAFNLILVGFWIHVAIVEIGERKWHQLPVTIAFLALACAGAWIGSTAAVCP